MTPNSGIMMAIKVTNRTANESRRFAVGSGGNSATGSATGKMVNSGIVVLPSRDPARTEHKQAQIHPWRQIASQILLPQILDQMRFRRFAILTENALSLRDAVRSFLCGKIDYFVPDERRYNERADKDERAGACM